MGTSRRLVLVLRVLVAIFGDGRGLLVLDERDRSWNGVQVYHQALDHHVLGVEGRGRPRGMVDWLASGCASGIRTATSCSMRSAEGGWRTVATSSSSVRRRTRLSVPNTTLVREYLEPEEVYEKRPPRG